VTILSLSTLAETRDPETGAHIERTRNYVKLLGEALKDHPRFRDELAAEGAIERLYRSAPLHDIGKVGTRDAILLKPDRLSDQEFDTMKEHTLLGANALRWAEQRLGSNSFLATARDIAACHHERWDGKGYPNGLAGETIPLCARLMALADVYDALRSRRVYKPPFDHAQARQIIIEGRGSQFDPDVVDAFCAIEEQFEQIDRQYQGQEGDFSTNPLDATQ
jgi:putative two-component system response regulator